MAKSIEDSFTVDQVALALGLHRNSVYAHIHKGRILAFRVGRSIRVLQSELNRLYTTNARPPAPVQDWKSRAANDTE